MWYDLIVFLILAYSAYKGALKGVVWQFAAIGGIILCFAFSEPLSLLVTPYISLEPPLDRWVAMLLFYLVFSFLSFFIARQLKSWIERKRFDEYDRHLGALFGFAKGTIFCLVLTFFLGPMTYGSMRTSVLSSFSGRVAVQVMHTLAPLLPDGLTDVIAPYLGPIQQGGSQQFGDASDSNSTGPATPNSDDENAPFRIEFPTDLPMEIPIELGPESLKDLLPSSDETEKKSLKAEGEIPGIL